MVDSKTGVTGFAHQYTLSLHNMAKTWSKSLQKTCSFDQVIAWKGRNMDRKQELLKVFDQIEDTKDVIMPMIDDVVFLEDQLCSLRKLPFLRVNPADPSQQKPTPAAKQYKELLQQYNNCIKILTSVLRKDAAEEESPLRAFINARKDLLS